MDHQSEWSKRDEEGGGVGLTIDNFELTVDVRLMTPDILLFEVF